MNLLQLAPFWAAGLLCLLLVAAAAEDALRLRISNLTVLGVIVSAVIAAVAVGLEPALWENLLVFALVLAAGTPLFSTGKVGGGDVKLLAAVGLWTDLERAMIVIAAVFITGGILALLTLIPRFLRRRPKGAARDSTKNLPYAVAIAVGALLVLAFERQADEGQQRSPLDFPTELS